MRDEKRAARAEKIEEAAYRVLDEKGYAGMSMLAVAREAKASNETLYRWYGDKTGLFRALILRNTEIVRSALQKAPKADAIATLTHIGPILLAMLLGPRAVALNRAAAADDSGTLGQALSISGRETVRPLIIKVIRNGQTEGALGLGDPDQMVETFFALLIGDCAIRRVTGSMAQPTPDWIETRAEAAIANFQRLFPPTNLDAPGRSA